MIKTRYNIGDTVFYLNNSTLKITQFEIQAVRAERFKYKSLDKTLYCDHHQGSSFWLEENKLFGTKEELIESL